MVPDSTVVVCKRRAYLSREGIRTSISAYNVKLSSMLLLGILWFSPSKFNQKNILLTFHLSRAIWQCTLFLNALPEKNHLQSTELQAEHKINHQRPWKWTCFDCFSSIIRLKPLIRASVIDWATRTGSKTQRRKILLQSTCCLSRC